MVRGGGEELRPCLIAGEGAGEGVGRRGRGAGGRETGKERLGGDAGEEVEGAGRRRMAAAEGGTDGGRRNPGSFPATGHGSGIVVDYEFTCGISHSCLMTHCTRLSLVA